MSFSPALHGATPFLASTFILGATLLSLPLTPVWALDLQTNRSLDEVVNQMANYLFAQFNVTNTASIDQNTEKSGLFSSDLDISIRVNLYNQIREKRLQNLGQFLQKFNFELFAENIQCFNQVSLKDLCEYRPIIDETIIEFNRIKKEAEAALKVSSNTKVNQKRKSFEETLNEQLTLDQYNLEIMDLIRQKLIKINAKLAQKTDITSQKLLQAINAVSDLFQHANIWDDSKHEKLMFLWNIVAPVLKLIQIKTTLNPCIA